VQIRTPLPIDATGAEALKQVFATLQRAYPDLHVTVEDLIEEGDKLVGRNLVTGTHRGEYMGIPPTGRRVSYEEIFIFRFVDGRIAEWGVVDVLAQMRQLGVFHAPGEVRRSAHRGLETTALSLNVRLEQDLRKRRQTRTTPKRRTMAKVLTHMRMSPDGYIADLDDQDRGHLPLEDRVVVQGRVRGTSGTRSVDEEGQRHIACTPSRRVRGTVCLRRQSRKGDAVVGNHSLHVHLSRRVRCGAQCGARQRPR
jgi:hypothetical protein